MFDVPPVLALALVLLGLLGAVLSGCGELPSPQMDWQRGRLQEGAWNIAPDVGAKKVKLNFSRSF